MLPLDAHLAIGLSLQGDGKEATIGVRAVRATSTICRFLFEIFSDRSASMWATLSCTWFGGDIDIVILSWRDAVKPKP